MFSVSFGNLSLRFSINLSRKVSPAAIMMALHYHLPDEVPSHGTNHLQALADYVC